MLYNINRPLMFISLLHNDNQSESATKFYSSIWYWLCFFTETKWQMFRRIPGFYSTSGAVDYTAVIFWAHLVAVKCEVFTTISITSISTREIQLCTQDMFPLLLADFTCQSIVHVQKSKWNTERGLLKVCLG